MKVLHIALPALAFVASGIWLSLQKKEISDLEIKTAKMEERIGMIKASDSQAAQTQASSSSPTDQLPPGLLLDNGSLNWVAVARFFSQNNRGGAPKDLRSLIQIQKKISIMEVADLIKTMKLLKRLDMPSSHREHLNSVLAGIFIQKDPQQALNFFQSKLSEQHTSLAWQLRSAVGQWAKNDPVAALAWFDKQKAAGLFESKRLSPHSEVEQSYGAQIYGAMLVSDPAEVDARLGVMSKSARLALLKNSSLWMHNPKSETAYFDLVRRNLPKSDQYDIIGTGIAMPVLRGGSLEDVSRKLETSEFSESERKAGIDTVAKHFARPWQRRPDELKVVYPWFGKEDPERQIELTARTYAHFGNHRNTNFEATFREVSFLAKEIQNPNLITQFAAQLKRPEQQLEQIKDEQLKASLIEVLATHPTENEE